MYTSCRPPAPPAPPPPVAAWSGSTEMALPNLTAWCVLLCLALSFCKHKPWHGQNNLLQGMVTARRKLQRTIKLLLQATTARKIQKEI
jgi:hypothetical protein